MWKLQAIPPASADTLDQSCLLLQKKVWLIPFTCALNLTNPTLLTHYSTLLYSVLIPLAPTKSLLSPACSCRHPWPIPPASTECLTNLWPWDWERLTNLTFEQTYSTPHKLLTNSDQVRPMPPTPTTSWPDSEILFTGKTFRLLSNMTNQIVLRNIAGQHCLVWVCL